MTDSARRQQGMSTNDLIERLEQLAAACDSGAACFRAANVGESAVANQQDAWAQTAREALAALRASSRSASEQGAQPETWWIALNGQGQIIGAFRTKEAAHANTNYVVGIQPDSFNVSSQPSGRETGERLELWGVFLEGAFYAAFPRRTQAEVYASGFSKPTDVRQIDGLVRQGAAPAAAQKEKP